MKNRTDPKTAETPSSWVNKNVHFAEQEGYEKIVQVAESLGITPSRFISEAALERAQRIKPPKKCPECGQAVQKRRGTAA